MPFSAMSMEIIFQFTTFKGASERSHRILKPIDLYPSSSASYTIKSQLIRLKDKVATYDKCGVVFKIDSIDCLNKYIGETERNLKMRLKEHQKNIRRYS